MTTCSGKSGSLSFLCVSFIYVYSFVCALLSLLDLRVGVGFDGTSPEVIKLFSCSI